MLWRACRIHVLAAVAASTHAAGPDQQEKSTPSAQLAAANALVSRVVGAAAAARIETALLPPTEEYEHGYFTVGPSASKDVRIAGTSGVEVASALSYYANHWLNTTFDWNTYGAGQGVDHLLDLLSTTPHSGLSLPSPASVVTVPRQVQWSYYGNVCMYGYSLPFVPWQDGAGGQSWVKHIDWMALQGINLPLAPIGQEWVWSAVFDGYNISWTDQQSFFSGPAFLPWQRMGNMQGWGGPISKAWLSARKDLQLKILAQMRGLGMSPVLSGFAGHVPHAFASKHPSVKTIQSPDWAGFHGADPATAAYADVTMIDPTDPAFPELGAKFIALQAKTYGTDHFYSCDTYNEINPASNSTAYLAKASASVYAGMAQVDPAAVWVMQAWSIAPSAFWGQAQISSYLGAVPSAKLWLLDLYAEAEQNWARTASFYGHPFIWCGLINFGGQQGITAGHGVAGANQVVSNFEQALAANNTLVGVGISMEGIWTNYPIFEMVLQGAYAGRVSNSTLPEWWAGYGVRRYGRPPTAGGVGAWMHLGDTVYGPSGVAGTTGSMISGIPAMSTWPPLPAPPGPPGFDLYHAQGYFPGYYTPPTQPHTVDECAGLCISPPANSPRSRCLGFEVYDPDPSGNCYLFFNLSREFVHQAGSAAYLRRNDSSRGVAASDPPGWDPPKWTSAFAETWRMLATASEELGQVPSFRFDLVDVAREVIASKFAATWAQYIPAYHRNDTVAAAAVAKEALAIIDDYDLLLSSDVNFMLGRWLAWADSDDWGQSPSSKAQLAFNARNILTLWGPTGQINDYAKKEWGGLVRGYYKPRYQLFFDLANNCTMAGTSWNQTEYGIRLLAQVELPFQTSRDVFLAIPETDTLETAAKLMAKYT